MMEHLLVEVAQARLAPHEASKASVNTTWCCAGIRLRFTQLHRDTARLRYLLSNHSTS